MINIDLGHHILCLGKTGEGKTIMCQYLASLFRRVIVFDIEQKDGWEFIPKAEVMTTVDQIKDLEHRQEFTVIFQPTIDNIISGKLLNTWDTICQLSYAIGNLALVCDEMAFTQPSPTKLMPWANGLIMLGRKRWVTTITASRRNQEIHKAYITQANHYLMFKLKNYDILAYTPFIEHVEKLRKLPKHYCLYVDDNGNYKIFSPVPIVVSAGVHPQQALQRQLDTPPTQPAPEPLPQKPPKPAPEQWLFGIE